MAHALRHIVAAALTCAAGSAVAFELTSPDISPDQPIADRHVFDGFGCKGGNVSPALA